MMKGRKTTVCAAGRMFILAPLLAALFLGACATAKPAADRPARESSAPPPPVAFEDSGQDLGKGDGRGIALGDVDADGDIDAFVCYGGGGSGLWLNDGKGRLSASGQDFGSGTAVALGDLDGDGHLDIFLTEEESGRIWLNDGSGKFTSQGW